MIYSSNSCLPCFRFSEVASHSGIAHCGRSSVPGLLYFCVIAHRAWRTPGKGAVTAESYAEGDEESNAILRLPHLQELYVYGGFTLSPQAVVLSQVYRFRWAPYLAAAEEFSGTVMRSRFCDASILARGRM